MRTHQICPKCGGHRIFLVNNVARIHPGPSGEDDSPGETFEAYVCEQCRYSELYTSQPLVADGKRIKRISQADSGVYEDWSSEMDTEGLEDYDNDWTGDEFEVTEISRVEKKPVRQHGAKVLLTRIGPRPADVLTVLRETLGLTIPSEEWLHDALPYVVLDLISIKAAESLQRLLEDAGGSVELQSRMDLK